MWLALVTLEVRLDMTAETRLLMLTAPPTKMTTPQQVYLDGKGDYLSNLSEVIRSTRLINNESALVSWSSVVSTARWTLGEN